MALGIGSNNATPETAALARSIRAMADDLYGLIDTLPPSQGRDIAKIKLQECVMWAVRAAHTESP